MIERLIGPLRQHIIRPALFFPLVAGLAVLSVYGVIEVVTRYEERLRAVRAALKDRGYPAGPTDAAMNSHTAEALRSFQRRQGLRITGRPDPATAMALGLERR